VDVTLTEDGMSKICVHITLTVSDHIDEIIEIVFSYVKLVRSSGIQEWIYNEVLYSKVFT
jgi:hypothetical protein